ncbi:MULTISPECIES: bifunctional 2-polyprenyl-6-hydroxyphenol methylase/3-demethylubiquinol 3-O-methyltransferase UbiG [unclassified Halorubrum]|uniref:class I SAM-dependent methyltransferase n=1 Tax=unclassified Halorubrum TaxID=2642239 RepID=UPI0010F4333A|nr:MULTISPECIES: methyltransferase [unclassified Halorubrum]TKX44570.1 methyltransferase domain-containing protein [Halorubrum sp. ARQ200]TKX49091.1 methyltransferase domain-containing protein [Halorubrum sp. ASP121]
MPDGLYDERPRLYDAIQSEWDYDRDVAFVRGTLADRGVDPHRLLEVGCGTGEHTRRLAAGGLDVTAIDVHEGMLGVAREKCADLDGDGTAEFRRTGIPDPDLGGAGPFDAAVAIRGVVNHLAPADLDPALAALRDRLRPGGVLVFDNSPLPPEGNRPGLDVGRDADEAVEYVRVAHHVATGDGRLDWRAVTFTPDGDPFVDARRMTPFADERIADALAAAGFDEVDTVDGYGSDDDRSVFVAVR